MYRKKYVHVTYTYINIFTPFKKSNATRLWSIIFLLSWICIHQIRYPCLFALRLMPYLFGLFHWGVCRMSKLGAVSKMKSCKIDRILWKCVFVQALLWAYARVPTAPGPIHCPFFFFYRNPRNKTSCWISNSDANFGTFIFSSNIITLRTFLTDNHKQITYQIKKNK